MPPVAILAGGRGTRLGPRVRDLPKPLIPVAGRPFVLHQLELLARYQITHVVLCVGYLGERFVEVVGAECFGIAITYSFDGPSLDGTLGAIARAAPLLGERFLVLYGDTYLRIDYAAAARAWERSGMPAMMAVLLNDGRWERSNATLDGELVIAHDKVAPTAAMRWIDYGLGGLTSAALSRAAPGERDLSALYGRLAAERELYGVVATERFYEIGTPASLAEAEAFLGGRRERGDATR